MNRDELITAAANRNADALEFLRAFVARAHWIDDLADNDKLEGELWYEPDAFAAQETRWLLTLTANPFFCAHRAQLVPAMVVALNAWVDSHLPRFAGPAGDVIKGQWHEVVWLVAWLTGGWEHLRTVTITFRQYDIEKGGADGPVR